MPPANDEAADGREVALFREALQRPKGPEREAFLDQACAGVIDFGIAKATQQELTEKTVYTQFQQFIGTPAYMSPEQAEMSGLGHQQSNSVFGVAISPDGRLLATVALGGRSTSGTWIRTG